MDFTKTETENALRHVNGDSWTTIHILKISREWIEAVAEGTYWKFLYKENILFFEKFFYEVLKLFYRDIHAGLYEYLRLINDLAERGVRKGDMVAQRSNGAIRGSDFTPTVQHMSIVHKNIPAASASVQKSTMKTGTDKMQALREKAKGGD